MDAIILAGGKGTRLRSVISDVPKPLAPVNGRPFLDLILQQLGGFRCLRKVVLATGYKAELIEARYRNSREFGFEIDFSHEAIPLGTGGAIAQALPLTSSSDILVMNGDSFVEFSLSTLIAMHSSTRALVTMVVVEVDDTSRFGTVNLDLSSGRVCGFFEKDGTSGPGFVNAGCYLIARPAIESFRADPSSLERDVLPSHLHSTYACVVRGKFIDIGVPESYSFAAEYLR